MEGYCYECRIRYSEVDHDGVLTLFSLIDQFQDASIFHSEDVQIGVSYLKSQSLAWVLSSWQIEVERYPHLGEVVTIQTLPYDMKGFMGFRNFAMYSQDGRRIACANSVWSLLDTNTMMPTKIPPIMVEKYGLGTRIEMHYGKRRIPIPEGIVKKDEILVRDYHLDTNQHVNNNQFVRFAMDACEINGMIREFRAEYKKQAYLGDLIIPYAATDLNGHMVVSLHSAKDEVFANMEFVL